MNIHDIRQKIEVLRNEQQALPNPSLTAIETRIQHHAARCIVGTNEEISDHKTKLQMAIHAKAEAERHLARHAELRNELARLNQDLELAEQFERVAVAQEATKRCEDAYLEYKLASMQCARAFRRVLDTNMQASNVKGAVTAPLDLRLHLPAVWSMYWAGTVGEHMIHAKLPFENSEEQA